MSQRFFVERPIAGELATLTGDEARHLARVMRAAVGDEVILFDGSGVEFLARVASLGKSAVELEIIERRAIDRELPVRLTLAVALPKADRQKWLVEKATELGVSQLVPLITERGVAQPVDSALVRLRRSVIEASKQCGRNRLMEIGEPAAAGAFFAATVQSPKSKIQSQPSEASGQGSDEATLVPCTLSPVPSIRLLADPSGDRLSATRWTAGDILAAVGPEGGFTPQELAAATEHGWQPVSLGRSILRVETAAVALAAWAALR